MSLIRRTFSFALCALLLIPAYAVSEDAAKPTTPTKDGWIEMFDGKSLDGWVVEGTKEFTDKQKTKQPVWTVRDGLIHCAGNGFGFLRFDKEVEDFIYHVEFRTTKGCNSGVGIRHVKFTGPAETRPSYSGYEIQILDDAGKPPTEHGTASLYRYVAATSNAVKPAGEWNTMVIECRGPKIKITLNGVVVQDVDQSTVAAIKDKPLSGYVSVQNHGKEIDFRNLRLQPLEKSGDAKASSR